MATPNLNNLINNKSEPESTRSVPGSVDLRQRLAVALPFLILAGFGGVFLLLFGDALLPSERVRLENVITIQAEASAGGSSKASTRESAPVLFQSSGWVEADPFPVKATALVSGVVDSVEVLEGDRVKKGDVLARLVSADAELDLRTAIGNKQSFEAQAESHHREVDAIKAEASATAKRISVAEARAREFADPARRLSNLSNANVSTGEVLQARLRLETQEAEIAALRAAYEADTARVAKHEALEKDYEGRLVEAAAEVDRRRLALERTTIRSPIDGIVQKLFAAPGEKRFLQMDGADSATIAILFDPDHLQARIDVPLEKAASVSVGQAVRIRTDLLPDKVLSGRVTSISGGADIQRNTLQVKVGIENPDERLRPDMLARAEFLSNAEMSGTSNPGIRTYVPEAALLGVGEGKATVWVANPEGKSVTPREIFLGSETRENARLVHEGLFPGERVVLDPPSDLQPGQKITPSKQ
jgi:HlyD family secretion protein